MEARLQPRGTHVAAETATVHTCPVGQNAGFRRAGGSAWKVLDSLAEDERRRTDRLRAAGMRKPGAKGDGTPRPGAAGARGKPGRLPTGSAPEPAGSPETREKEVFEQDFS